MRKLLLTTMVLAITGIGPISSGLARGGHGHGHQMHRHHGHSTSAVSAPANPSVPPSLTPDPKLTGSAPLPAQGKSKNTNNIPREKLDPEDAQLDKKIKSICRGC